MDQQLASDRNPGAETQRLSNLVLDLNIARRNIQAYPKGHQVIDASLEKVLVTYALVVEQEEEVVLGVAFDSFLLGDQQVGKSHPVLRDFARLLYERGIGVLLLRRGLTGNELRRFITILGAKREQIYAAGGIEAVWEKARLVSLGVRAIRYDLFTATEEARLAPGEGRVAGGLWERFARGLVQGLLVQGEVEDGALEPELLAQALNRQATGTGGFQKRGAELARLLREGEGGRPGQGGEPACRQLASFVTHLSPELRRQFLGSAFRSRALLEGTAESLVRSLPLEAVLETLEEVNRNGAGVPPLILEVLKQMSQVPAPAPSAAPLSAAEELQERMRTIFKEHAMEEFIPQSYQGKLHRMMMPDRVPELGPEGVHDLMETLEPAVLERSTGEILLMLLRQGETSEEGYAALSGNLYDIATFFLQTGEYGELLRILHELGGEGVPPRVREALLELFGRREFVDEVLDGLETWGKPKFEAITEVIQAVGAPFIEGLLDRLACAESMSLRRFLMDRLVEFGEDAGPALLERLSDGPWYFLRNLIGVVRQLNLVGAADRLRVLSRHRDARVGQEAFRVLLQFRDPEAEGRLARDLESGSRETRLAALRMAGRCGSPVVLDKLHAMLERPGTSGKACEVKGLVVQALGEIANPASLPVLEGVLGSGSLWHPVLWLRFKLEVVASLGRFPASAARPLLARLASGRGELARQAAQLLNGTSGGIP